MILTVPSSLEVTTRELSWSNRAAVTQLVWPRITESRLAGVPRPRSTP